VNKILIVDDDEDIREAVRNSLEQQGFYVACASNGHEALQMLRAESAPCLVLLDLLMPVMSGWQFRAIQVADPVLRQFPVVVMTATSSLEDAAIAADGLLRKPIRFDTLVETVRRFCTPEEFEDAKTVIQDGSVWQELQLNDSNPANSDSHH
jgi:CheY-like chemotaxis protein